MSDSIRQQIIDAIESRLADIRTAKGYQTEIGSNVFKGKTSIDSADTPAVGVFAAVEEVTREYDLIRAIMPIKIEGEMLHGSSNVSEISEQMLSDIIENITGDTWTIPFTSGGTYEIETGDTITGASSSVTAFVQTVTLATGTWAGADAAGTLTIRRLTGDFSAENFNVDANLNVATTTGVETYSAAITNSTNDLAEDIVYSSGGTDAYPDVGDKATGAYAIFNVEYTFKNGDPFSQ